jgi:hypothetical protein
MIFLFGMTRKATKPTYVISPWRTERMSQKSVVEGCGCNWPNILKLTVPGAASTVSSQAQPGVEERARHGQGPHFSTLS